MSRQSHPVTLLAMALAIFGLANGIDYVINLLLALSGFKV
jgi:hypothetical protein